MKKWLRYIAVFAFGGVVLPLAVHLAPTKQLGIVAADGTKFYVPSAIVERRNCVQFDQWRDSLARPGFVPTQECPWAPKQKGIGNFTLNGAELRVPREYLWQQANQADGPVADEALYIMASFPGMKPASADGDQTNNIMVTLVPNRTVTKYKAYVNGYRTRSGLYADDYVPNSPSFKRLTAEIGVKAEQLSVKQNQPIFISSVSQLGLDYYEVPASGYASDIFLKGNPLTPDEWVICTHNYNSRCDSWFEINDQLLAQISFQQFPNLEQYQQLQPAIRRLIISFIQQKGA